MKKKKPKREQNRKSPNIAHWLRGKQAWAYLEKIKIILHYFIIISGTNYNDHIK